MQPPVDPVGDLVAQIGEAPIRALVAAFYAQVPGDDLLGPMYPKGDFAGAEERLRDFLVQRFGGPTRYSDLRGHPRLRMRHAAFPVDLSARDRWLELMERSLAGSSIPADAQERIRRFLSEVATFLINR